MTKKDTSISLDELKAVAKSLQSQKDTINTLYKNKIKAVLTSTNTCFGVNGVDFSDIENAFNNSFNNLNNYYGDLINVLNNDVIARYSELLDALRKTFNQDLKSKLMSYLKISSSKSKESYRQIIDSIDLSTEYTNN